MADERAVFAEKCVTRSLKPGAMVAADLEAYERGAWIEITDDEATLPEERAQVLVLIGGKQYVGLWNGPGTGYGWCVDGWPSGAKPTHWRPMPAGPGRRAAIDKTSICDPARHERALAFWAGATSAQADMTETFHAVQRMKSNPGGVTPQMLEAFLRSRGWAHEVQGPNWKSFWWQNLNGFKHIVDVPQNPRYIDYESCVIRALRCVAEAWGVHEDAVLAQLLGHFEGDPKALRAAAVAAFAEEDP